MTFQLQYRRDHGATVWHTLNTIYPPLIAHYADTITAQNEELGFQKYRIVEVGAELQRREKDREWERVGPIGSHELESIAAWVSARNAEAGYERLRLVESS